MCIFVFQGRGASLPQGGAAGLGARQRGAGGGPGPPPQQARGQVGAGGYKEMSSILADQ
jgi:hypothetical protein